MQNYNNVSGTYTVMASDNVGGITRQVITGISPTHNGNLDFGDSDTIYLSYPPDIQAQTYYEIYFTTPNDGINHSYTFNAELHIPAGPTHEQITIWPYQIFYWHLGSWTSIHDGTFWWTVDAPADWIAVSHTQTFSPNAEVKIRLPILFGINFPNKNDTCPFSMSISVVCNNPVEGENIVQMIIEQN